MSIRSPYSLALGARIRINDRQGTSIPFSDHFLQRHHSFLSRDSDFFLRRRLHGHGLAEMEVAWSENFSRISLQCPLCLRGKKRTTAAIQELGGDVNGGVSGERKKDCWLAIPVGAARVRLLRWVFDSDHGWRVTFSEHDWGCVVRRGVV
jgi:hypothetical protein